MWPISRLPILKHPCLYIGVITKIRDMDKIMQIKSFYIIGLQIMISRCCLMLKTKVLLSLLDGGKNIHQT